jgi:hypothetical protein
MVFCGNPRVFVSLGERSTVRSLASRVSWLLTGVFAATAAVVTLAGVRSAEAQFTPFSHDTRNILEGNWQSCRERDGQYSERVYDHAVSGISKFEVHLGPRREFALFKGVQEAHRDHDSPDNLLKPYRVVMDAGRAKQRWEIPSLNLAFTVTLAGGSRTDCESWYILLEPLEKTSH